MYQNLVNKPSPEVIKNIIMDAVSIEKEFITESLSCELIGMNKDLMSQYIDYIADCRLEGVGLNPLSPGVDNPFPWLAEMMDIKKEQNFFEGRVTEYQKSSSLETVNDDEL